jgi:hypothetical protein
VRARNRHVSVVMNIYWLALAGAARRGTAFRELVLRVPGVRAMAAG